LQAGFQQGWKVWQNPHFAHIFTIYKVINMGTNVSPGTTAYNVNGESKCPFSSGIINKTAGGGTSNRDWWPNQLKLNILRQHSSLSNPMGEQFDYARIQQS
jgi:catalase (peroxidase I)